MKTIKSMMMVMTAVVAMMTASVNPANAVNNKWRMVTAEELSTSSKSNSITDVMQYYYINNNNESRRFEYSVDSQGRVIDRVMYGWDNSKQAWYPMTMMHANYGHKTHKLTFATWNPERESFCDHLNTQSFDANDYSTLISLPKYANK